MQSRCVLREGVRKGEKKHRASPTKENRGNGYEAMIGFFWRGFDSVALDKSMAIIHLVLMKSRFQHALF